MNGSDSSDHGRPPGSRTSLRSGRVPLGPARPVARGRLWLKQRHLTMSKQTPQCCRTSVYAKTSQNQNQTIPFRKYRYAQFYKKVLELGKSELGEHGQDGLSGSPKGASTHGGHPRLPWASFIALSLGRRWSGQNGQ